MKFNRASGILLHPTSLPGPYGIGDLGPQARSWIDFLNETKTGLWQVLPLGPTGYGDSPYQTFSSFAGNPFLVSPDDLVREDLLHPNDIAVKPEFNAQAVDYGQVIYWKLDLLSRSFLRFQDSSGVIAAEAKKFYKNNANWLDDYAMFMALKEFHGGKPWSDWKTEYREVYSKKFAREILKKISNQIDSEIVIAPEQQTEICTTQSEIEGLLNRWQKLMVKAPWSSSGRGLQPITKTPVHSKVWEKLLGMVQEQGYVMVEPLLDKKLDMAIQFELSNGKVTYLGISRFAADKKGQYMGNFLNGFADSISHEVMTFARSLPGKIVGPLISAIEKSKLAAWYEGHFGVDLLIYTDENNCLKVNPCLEINVRQNMGLLSLQLEKLLLPGKTGMFRTFYQPGKTYLTFKKEMEKKHPLQLSQRKIEAGFISLTEANEFTRFGAYILV